MNYSLQLHSSNRTYPVPRGLHDLMADIAREVLRNKPQKIEKFIYNYLDSLMKIRKVGRGVATEVDKAISVGIKQMRLLEKLGITQEEADKAAAKVQAVVRGYQARKEVRELLQKKGKKTICYLDTAQMTADILKKYKLTIAQANSICTKIQAFFRGWLVRNKKLNKFPSHESWRHDWLWKEFQMSPEEVQAVTHAEKKQQTKEELLFQPRRSIEIDHIKFMNAFKGELADYDDRTDSSSMEDFSPSEEQSEEQMKQTEQKTDQSQDQQVLSEVEADKTVEQEKEKTIEEIVEKEEKESGVGVESGDEERQENEVAEKERVEEKTQEVVEEMKEQEPSEMDHEKDLSQEQISEEQVISELDELTEEESFHQKLVDEGGLSSEEKPKTAE